MPVKNKTILLTVTGNLLSAADLSNGALTTDAGVQGENGAVVLHCPVPPEWQDLTCRLRIVALNGAYDESDLPVSSTIDMPIRQGVTVPGRLTVSLIGSDSNGNIRKTADCKTLSISPSDLASNAISKEYPMDFENLYQQVQTNQSTMNSHTANISNPHQVNYQQAGAEPAGSVSAHNNDSNAHGSLFVKNVTGSGAVLVTRNGNNVNVSVTGAGGGDMLTANYANGSGSSNANSVDRAKYSDDVSISKSTTLNNSSPAFQTGTSDTNQAPISFVDGSSVQLAFNGRTLSNVITNGNFATSSNNLATGFTLSSASAVLCTGNTQTFIATAQNGLILSPVQGVTNHRYFIIASVKATSNQVALSLQNATLTVPYHPGDGNYHTLYAIATLGSTAGYPYIQDRGTSGWQNISVQNFMAIDMGTDATNPYYNYTKDQMNNLINGYIDGTKSIVNPKFLSTGKNLFNSATITNGYAMGTSGSPFVSSGWWASDFVPVIQGKAYIFTGLGPTTYSYVCFYSANKAFLSSLTNTAVISAGKMITVPAGAYYVRFAAASSAGAFQLELGSAATTYEAYKSSILSITGIVTASDRFTWDGITGKIDGSAVVTSGNLQAYQNGWVFVQNSDGTPVTVVPATEVTYNLLGDMRISGFANGSGSANTNKVDHAVFAEVGTTRTQGDNSSKLSTTAYVDSGLSGKMPMSNNTSGIVGYFTKISGTVGAAYSLPTGGTWEYFGFLVNSSTGAIFGPTGFFAGVSAGGTQVAAATSGYYPAGYIRRIA